MARPLTIVEGANHHRSKYPSDCIDIARDLADEDQRPAAIVRILAKRGYIVPLRTVIDWIRYKTRVIG